jgi:tripartite-type tricarboxylate transporter receptor subunit TctC
VSEFLPGFEASNWQGVGAPKNTPAEIIDTLNRAVNAVLTDTRSKQQLTEMDSTAIIGSPSDFGKLIADETEKWGSVIRSASIKPT